MKGVMREILISLVMGMVLPSLLVHLTVAMLERPTEAVAPAVALPAGRQVGVLLADGTREALDLEEYLVGVVLGEMPAAFEGEALKAQAVVARTYTLRGGKHDAGALCTDPGCCQAYCSPEEYREKGGGEEDLEKIRSAVADTAGLVLTYEGELIEATYFSCSGGVTEDAAAVWGTDYPYLRSVESPGEEQAAVFLDTVSFTGEEFAQKLGLVLTGAPETWLGEMTRTAGEGVDTMSIGGTAFRGTELRKKLGLRSTNFTMEASPEGITVTTKGYGHRVGMSQYGADAMAVGGSSFADILAHYYPGTALEQG